jgi:hypothetical protein
VKTLVAGWFSFEGMGATAGDLLTRDLVCRWLEDAGRQYVVAVATPFQGGIDWREASPADYSDIVFVCGPFGNGWPIPEFLERFAGRRLVGVNLSMLEPLEAWNPFDLLLERDSSVMVRPDLAFLASVQPVPVVGMVLVHEQKEYRGGAHHLANAAIERLAASRPMAIVKIDTRLDVNGTGLRTAGEVESLIARMDAVLTTRLHGLVLSLKHGVPAVAIDPIAGGAKLRRQALAIGWSAVFVADALNDRDLAGALDYCLSAAGREDARSASERARGRLLEVRDRFTRAMKAPVEYAQAGPLPPDGSDG